MNRARTIRALALGGLIALSAVARAQEVPSHFVPADDCMSRPCVCDDIPMIETFLQNQKDARDAWLDVRGEIFSSTGPQSVEEAVASFQSKYSGDPSVTAQFMMCPGYDPAVNKASKIAGVSSSGGAMLDPCFCAAFCQDIVDSTAAHERMHVPTNIAGVVGKAQFLVACKVGALPDRVCNALMPLILADSEIASYQVGISLLESDLNDLRASDPDMPEMACTWEPPVPEQQAAAVPAEAGFFERVALLLERILFGKEPAAATQQPALATLDVRR
jgi:hypothetical protein